MYQAHPDARAMTLGSNLIANNPLLPIQIPNNVPILPIQPDIKLKKLPFYDCLATIVNPTVLITSSNSRTQEQSYQFSLTPQQATEIGNSRDTKNPGKPEYPIQIQLRFCIYDTTCEQDDFFPPGIAVKVNGKPCTLPAPIPTNRPNTEAKRPPRPVNATPNVKLSPTVPNTVTVQWTGDLTKAYVLSVYLVRKLTSQQLLNRMKNKGIKPVEFTRQLIKDKLKEDADCEIATTMLKVSLMCPLGKMRMSIPCRASTCSHLQCFDALLFLQMNERKPTWHCPVCDRPALYDTLVIDGYFQEVLSSSLLTPNDNEIQLNKDGSWTTHVMGNENNSLEPQKKIIKNVEVISDDIELITEVEEKIEPSTIKTDNTASNIIVTTLASLTTTTSLTATSVTTSNPLINQPASTSANSVTVDLTLSDNEDDMPLIRKKTASASINKNANTNQLITPLPSAPASTVSTASSSSSGLLASTLGNNQTKSGINVQSSKKGCNNQNDLSIISLDSPSPPPSPFNNHNENGLNTNNNSTNNSNSNNKSAKNCNSSS